MRIKNNKQRESTGGDRTLGWQFKTELVAERNAAEIKRACDILRPNVKNIKRKRSESIIINIRVEQRFNLKKCPMYILGN